MAHAGILCGCLCLVRRAVRRMSGGTSETSLRFGVQNSTSLIGCPLHVVIRLELHLAEANSEVSAFAKKAVPRRRLKPNQSLTLTMNGSLIGCKGDSPGVHWAPQDGGWKVSQGGKGRAAGVNDETMEGRPVCLAWESGVCRT